ncbi:hypothetical protein ABVT39_019514 [Epinephelus coioides]
MTILFFSCPKSYSNQVRSQKQQPGSSEQPPDVQHRQQQQKQPGSIILPSADQLQLQRPGTTVQPSDDLQQQLHLSPAQQLQQTQQPPGGQQQQQQLHPPVQQRQQNQQLPGDQCPSSRQEQQGPKAADHRRTHSQPPSQQLKPGSDSATLRRSHSQPPSPKPQPSSKNAPLSSTQRPHQQHDSADQQPCSQRAGPKPPALQPRPGPSSTESPQQLLPKFSPPFSGETSPELIINTDVECSGDVYDEDDDDEDEHSYESASKSVISIGESSADGVGIFLNTQEVNIIRRRDIISGYNTILCRDFNTVTSENDRHSAVPFTLTSEVKASVFSETSVQRGFWKLNTQCLKYNDILAVRNDEELNKLLGGVTIAQGGVLPNIQAVLLPKKTEKAAKSK